MPPGGVLTSFSPTGDQFAVATPDGRVKVFETGSGRLLVALGDAGGKANGLSNGHLIENHTALAWVGGKEKGKKKQPSGKGGLAVGCANGDVKVYDVQLGELRWRAVDAVQGGVKALASGPGIVYATGSNCAIVALKLEDGEVAQRFDASKYPITGLALSPEAKHVFGGGSSMQLWSLSEQERVAKYTGHPTEVRAVVFVPGHPHAVSAASGERSVAVWEVPPRKKSKKQHPAVTTLNVEDPVVQLDACCSDDGEAFSVAAVSEGGEAYVWNCRRDSAAEAGPGEEGDGRLALACQLVMRVRVGAGRSKGSAAGKDEAVLGVRFQSGPSGPSLLVARGSTAKPAFEALSVPAEAPSTDEELFVSLAPVRGVLLPGKAGGGAGGEAAGTSGAAAPLDKSLQPKARQVATSGPNVSVLGSDNIGQPVGSRVAAEAAASGRKRGADTDDPEAGAGAAGSAGIPAGEEEVPDLPEGEVPLGVRVAALEARALGEAPGEQGEAGTSAPMPGGSAKADSLSVLLTQAIRSNDRALLERCLATSNNTIITNTVARIVSLDAALFLKAAVDRLLSKPNRAVQLVPWIRAVLHHHTAYLMSAPGVQPALTSLFQAIDSRVKLQEPLLRLYGRLGLVLHHTRDKSASEVQRPEPEVVFEDDMDDDEPAAEEALHPEGASNGDEDDDDDLDSEDGSDDSAGGNEFDAMLAEGDDEDDSIDDDLLDDLM